MDALLVAMVFPGIGEPVRAEPAPLGDRYRDFIAEAGNAEADTVRLAHLRKLAHRCAVHGVALAGLDHLIAFIERWDSAALVARSGPGPKPAQRAYSSGIRSLFAASQ